jgi:hypothetical protein
VLFDAADKTVEKQIAINRNKIVVKIIFLICTSFIAKAG